jgi:hypothetical protein
MNKRFPWPAQRVPILTVHVVRSQLDLYHLPDDSVHAPGFLGQITDVMKQDMMVSADPMFSHGWFLWMIQPDMVLSDHGFNGTTTLSSRPGYF